MTHEQMVAWLILEGWVPYPSSAGSLAATQNTNAACVLENDGSVTYIGHRFGWADECSWDEMNTREVEKFYIKIQENQND